MSSPGKLWVIVVLTLGGVPISTVTPTAARAYSSSVVQNTNFGATARAPVRSPSLPDGAPPALYAPEPRLPTPSGWRFGEAFPRTSGFGRVSDGALFWSDFLYDDHGASGVQVGSAVAPVSPSDGTYIYPDGPAAENGADIFRAAVGTDATSTWWRVDWQTLVDPRLPIAMWALDTDDDPSTGAATWPAGAGVRSPGVERWLAVSSSGARLMDGAGRSTSVQSFVDLPARSFLVHIPKEVLPAAGRWRVRLVAGLADPAGSAFAPVGPDHGALPGQPAVYNVAFRSDAQEPIVPSNWWREDAQAAALGSGDVSAFAALVDWRALEEQRSTPEPRPVGFTNRWFVSSIELGQGILRNPPQWSSDMSANFLNRVQPYGVYVPRHLGAGAPTPLTLMLHSLDLQHNQYAVFNPAFVEGLCERRRSICVTPFGRGPDSWYFDEGELDVWEVWNRIATAYALDPDRTVVSGYSMGGFGTYRFGLEHPDLFAGAVVLAGAPNCTLRVVAGVEVTADPGLRQCETEADFTPLVENARELPFYIGHGALDELAFSSSAVEMSQKFDALGYRYRFELYGNRDHVTWMATGVFDGAVAWLAGATRRDRDPATISYRFYASHQRRDLGVGPSAIRWLSGLAARGDGPGLVAKVLATSHALGTTTGVPNRSAETVLNGDGAGAATGLRWAHAERRQRGARNAVEMHLESVSAVTVDLDRAGIPAGSASVVTVQSDGPSAISLIGLLPGARAGDLVADGDGRLTVRVGAGTTTIRVLDRSIDSAAPRARTLPATGGRPPSFPLAAVAVGAAVGLALVLRRSSTL